MISIAPTIERQQVMPTTALNALCLLKNGPSTVDMVAAEDNASIEEFSSVSLTRVKCSILKLYSTNGSMVATAVTV